MSHRPHITLLGGKGMLGSDFTAIAGKRDWSVTALDLPAFDITRADHLERAVAEGGVILNCAAYTNVEKAESEPELAHQVNAEAVGRLGEIAAKAGAAVVHISTDFVFDGMLDRPYRETDKPHPISAYGLSKWRGEEALASSGCRHCIVRIEWTYGRHGVNFIQKLLDAARAGKPLRVVDDQVGAPTATTMVSTALCDLLAGDFPEGVFHLAASGYVSRYGMAQFMFDSLKMDVELSPCKTSDFASAAKRPLNSRFNCDKIAAALGTPIEHWKETLKVYLEQL
jgi:dTDP-4-dehydrorhamnose reductase